MSFEHTHWIWMNGRMFRWADGVTHVSAHALHYGTGVFEGIRCYETPEGPAVFRIDAHLDRFFESAAVYGLEISFSREQLTKAVCDVIVRNGFRSAYVRPLCYFGSNALGIRAKCPTEVVILAWPNLAHASPENKIRGIRATVSSWVKFDRRMMPPTAKASGQYLNSVLAARQASLRGFDEALLLNLDGNLAEATVANIFLVRDGMLLTNDETCSILPGITRDTVIHLVRSLGYSVDIGPLRLNDLQSADEAFLTGTAAEVLPIRELDGMPIGNGRRGPVTEKIQQAFDAVTHGKDPKRRSWLHFVAPQQGSRERQTAEPSG